MPYRSASHQISNPRRTIARERAEKQATQRPCQAARAPLEIVKRPDANGFVTLPKRWIVESAFGWQAAAGAPPRR